MKFAPIAPESFGHYLFYGLPTTYHFALGQELVRDRGYRKVYCKLGEMGKFIIVDNGAAENDQVPFEEIVKVSNEIGAAEIILPDVLRDGAATAKLTCDHSVLAAVPPSKRMIVPQGSTFEEWEYCFRWIDHELKGQYASIGIPKHFESQEGGRPRLLAWLMDHFIMDLHEIHLLGVYNNLWDEALAASKEVKGIRGIDSGAPVAQAQAGHRIEERAEKVSLNWSSGVNLMMAHENILTAIYSLRMLR